jgi:hypothetical protein
MAASADSLASYLGTVAEVSISLEARQTPDAVVGFIVLDSELSEGDMEFVVTRETWIGSNGRAMTLYDLGLALEVRVASPDLSLLDCPCYGTAARIDVREVAAAREGPS